MKAFLKENFVLIAGIMLPLIVAFIFYASIQINRVNIDPPQYKVIFTSSNNYKRPYYVYIKDSQAYFQYTEQKNNSGNGYVKPTLFVFDPQTNHTSEIDLPDLDETKKKDSQLISYFKGKKLSSSSTSPDGYKFTREYRRNGNLMTEIFGGGYRSRSNHVLEKDSNRVIVDKAPRYNAKFIGWILEE